MIINYGERMQGKVSLLLLISCTMKSLVIKWKLKWKKSGKSLNRSGFSFVHRSIRWFHAESSLRKEKSEDLKELGNSPQIQCKTFKCNKKKLLKAFRAFYKEKLKQLQLQSEERNSVWTSWDWNGFQLEQFRPELLSL